MKSRRKSLRKAAIGRRNVHQGKNAVQPQNYLLRALAYTKASRILDLPVNTLRDWAKAWKAGKFTEDISKHLYRYDDEVREKAVRMRLTGHTWRAIQNETGASAVSVRRWIEQYTSKGGRKKKAFAWAG